VTHEANLEIDIEEDMTLAVHQGEMVLVHLLLLDEVDTIIDLEEADKKLKAFPSYQENLFQNSKVFIYLYFC
jgi:hypothetical protein